MYIWKLWAVTSTLNCVTIKTSTLRIFQNSPGRCYHFSTHNSGCLLFAILNHIFLCSLQLDLAFSSSTIHNKVQQWTYKILNSSFVLTTILKNFESILLARYSFSLEAKTFVISQVLLWFINSINYTFMMYWWLNKSERFMYSKFWKRFLLINEHLFIATDFC